jgi:hypothetical protein
LRFVEIKNPAEVFAIESCNSFRKNKEAGNMIAIYFVIKYTKCSA